MGNQLAVMAHTKRGDEIIVGADCHIVRSEGGAAAMLSSVSYRIVGSPDGIICAEDIKRGIRAKNIHYPDTGLLCLENALGNGRAVPMDLMREAYETAHAAGVPVHLDGARIFNAAHCLGVDAREIADLTDSVMFCLSKGLGAPVGSILAGSHAFIEEARRGRKRLGGGMRQAGVLAAPGLIALEEMTERLKDDHVNARYLAEKLAALEHVECVPEEVQINMVFFKVTKPGFSPDVFVKRMAENSVVISGEFGGPGKYRWLTHYGIERSDIDGAVGVLSELLGLS